MVIKNYETPFLKGQEPEEELPIVDDSGKIIGRALRSLCHKNKTLLHPVVHLHVLNNAGKLYLQKRSPHKLVQPAKWDTSVGGHISLGETIEEALYRETEEEIKLTRFKPELIKKYIWESDIERELVYVFKVISEVTLGFNPEEITVANFWSREEILTSLGKGVFTPNFEREFLLLDKQLFQN